jgi:uncharacterized membrane protein YccF (DUF307 family)
MSESERQDLERASERASAPTGAGSSSVVVQHARGPNFFLRVLWYVFIGWWLTGIALAVGYLAGITIIGLPLAFLIFNRTGTLLTLRPRSETVTLTSGADGTTQLERARPAQRPLLLRAIYFVLIGWWLALIWMVIAYLVSLTIIGIPVGIMMLNRLPAIFTLHRN